MSKMYRKTYLPNEELSIDDLLSFDFILFQYLPYLFMGSTNV